MKQSFCEAEGAGFVDAARGVEGRLWCVPKAVALCTLVVALSIEDRQLLAAPPYSPGNETELF